MPDHNWIQVLLLAPPEQAEALADFLGGLSNRGVELREPPPSSRQVEVIGFLADDQELDQLKQALEEYLAFLGQQTGSAPEVFYQLLPDQDWGENWKKHFVPASVSKGFMVAPPWQAGQPAPGQHCLIIDPGQAFGTGQHQSTALCLERLEDLSPSLPFSLLDMGCGTGILALAYLRLQPAGRALGLDIDPLALAAARHNAELNGLTHRLDVSSCSLAEVGGRFPLITANLTADLLVSLAAQLEQKLDLTPGSELILAGILNYQAAQVAAAFTELGLVKGEDKARAEWRRLSMLRP